MVTGVYPTEMLHHSAMDFPDASECQTQVYHIILVLLQCGRNVYI